MSIYYKTSYSLAGVILLLAITELFAGTVSLLHSGDTLSINHGTTPVVDGYMSSGEWSDAVSVVLVEPGGAPGDVTVYLKHDTNNFYAAFDNSNSNNWVWWLLIDTQNNGGAAPQADDYKLIGPGYDVEYVGNGSDWVEVSPTGWSSMGNEFVSECYVSYSKLGITPGIPKTVGLAICYGGAMPWEEVWPPGFDTWNEEVIPNTWGDVVSNNSWGQGPGVKEYNPGTKAGIHLQSFPNPVSTTLKLVFTLLKPDHVALRVYDIEGMLVRILIDKEFIAGQHELFWDRKDDHGKIVPAGTYFCQLRTAQAISTLSIVVVK